MNISRIAYMFFTWWCYRTWRPSN